MDRIDVQPLTAASADRLDRLFRRYSARVLGYVRTQTRDNEAAQDVAAETWLRAGKRLHLLEAPDQAAFPWLRVIAQYAAIDHYRGYERPEDWTDAVASRALPAAASAEDAALPEPPAPATVDPELVAALAALPEQDRTVVRLRMEGMTYDEIGRTYGRSVGAAYWRYRRALRTLAAVPALAG
ncbi:RNA polymerase sigma factor [Streptomyces albidoflavus]|uniref:RNA polymerase sigma factor n=1 Tax=Streptomyces albidoflavus TaxID=1886 RepID=UPI00332A58CA